MKAILNIFLLLAAVNGGMLYWHYSQAAGGDEQELKPYRQEIEVINRTDGLYVRHHFFNLSEGKYEIIWPAASAEQGCASEGASSCSRLNEAGTAFDEGEREQQTVVYKLPKKQPLAGRKLFKQPFAQLKGAKSLTTVFHMTDEEHIGGMWVTGLQQAGAAERERISYRLYRGVGDVSELYWQPRNVPLAFSNDRLTIYSEGVSSGQNEQMKKMLEGVGGDHISVVVSPQNETLYANRFIIDSTANLPNVFKQIARISVSSRYKLLAEEPSMHMVITSVLADEASGTKAEKAIFNTIKETLDEGQYEQFKQEVRNRIGKKLSASDLDDMLLGLTGLQTEFFYKTLHEQRYSYPLIWLDPRSVTVNEKEAEDVKIVLQNGKSYYPAEELLSRMDYTITSNEQSIYINSPSRSYRFSRIEPFYMMNDRRFNYQEKPYTMINKKLYFDEVWFRRIFLILIEKNDKTIDIEQIEQMIKEMEKE